MDHSIIRSIRAFFLDLKMSPPLQFACRIARTQATTSIANRDTMTIVFFHVVWYRDEQATTTTFFYIISSEWWHNNTNIAICEELRYDDEMQQSNLYTLSIARTMTTSIPSRSDDSYSFDVARSGRIARERATWRHHRETRGRNNQTLYMLLVARMTATSTVDCNYHGNELLLQEAMTRITFFMSWYCTARMTAKRKRKTAPPNNQHF